jgi:hypothetical protein
VSGAPVRVGAYPTLDKKTIYNQKTKKMETVPDSDEKGRYRVSFIFDLDSDDLKRAEDAAKAVARAKWPDLAMNQVKFPFKSGDKINAKLVKDGKRPQAEIAGKVTLRTTSSYVPLLSSVEGGKVVDYETDDAVKLNLRKFYGGVLAGVELNFVANGDPDNENMLPSVNAYVNAICSLNKGERLGNRRPGSETFKGYAGKYSSTDPTGQAGASDDEIPY